MTSTFNQRQKKAALSERTANEKVYVSLDHYSVITSRLVVNRSPLNTLT